MRGTLYLFSTHFPEWFSVQRVGSGSPEELNFGKVAFKYVSYYLEGVHANEAGSRMRTKLLVLAYAMQAGASFLDCMVEGAFEPPEAIWDKAFGVGGCLLNEASMAYEYDLHHALLLSQHSWDGCLRVSHTREYTRQSPPRLDLREYL